MHFPNLNNPLRNDSYEVEFSIFPLLYCRGNGVITMNPLFDSNFLNQVNALIPLAGFQPKILEDIENGNRKSQSVVQKNSYTSGLEERFHAPSKYGQ